MYKNIIYLIILLDLSFFYLVPINNVIGTIISNYQKIGLSASVIISFIIYIKHVFSKRKYLFLKNLIIFILLVLAEVFLSYLSYGQGIKTIIVMTNQYFVILAYFIFCYYIEKEKGIYSLEKILLLSTLIISVLLIVQYCIYNINETLFLYIDGDRLGVARRFGSIRIYESSYYITFNSVLAFGILVKNKCGKKLKSLALLTFVISMIEIIVVFKGRSNLIFILISILFIIGIRFKKKKLQQVIVIPITVASLILILNIPKVKIFFESFNVNEASVTIRVRAMDYYINQTKDNFLFGTGFIEAKENDLSYYMVRGDEGLFYKDDMGIIGLMNTFGIIGFMWYIMIFYKLLKVLLIAYKKKIYISYIEIYGLAFFIICSCVVLNPLDAQRIIVFPLLLSLIDYINKVILNKSENSKVYLE